jgi:hypothetical protein
MFRLSLAAVVALTLVSYVPAASSAKKTPYQPVLKAAPEQAKEADSAESHDQQYVMNAATEVLLDGQSCSYEAIPDSAVITSMEVAPDRRTIVRVFFRSKAK